VTPERDLVEAAGWLLLTVGLLVRASAAVDETRRLKLAGGADRDDGLRGSYVATCIGVALTAIGLVMGTRRALGDPGLLLALAAAGPLLAISDLLPRALAPARPKAGTSVRWAATLGRILRPIEHAVTGHHDRAWTHEGLTPLVHTDSRREDAAERDMARRVYDFGDVTVSDIMVPLVDVSAIRDDSPIQEVVRIATREGFSRLPVFHERLPNVIGILHVFDLLVPAGARTASDCMKPPSFVPEMTPASDVLRRLQTYGVNLAVVVDEYGGAIGIVTIADILEEVVGEIEDEYDEGEEPVREVGPGTWMVDGRAEIERLNERFAWKLPDGEYETLGGLLLAHLARIPEVGEGVALGRVILTVTAASPRSVDEIRVETRADFTGDTCS